MDEASEEGDEGAEDEGSFDGQRREDGWGGETPKETSESEGCGNEPELSRCDIEARREEGGWRGEEMVKGREGRGRGTDDDALRRVEGLKENSLWTRLSAVF